MSTNTEKAARHWGQDRHPDERRYHWLNHPVTRGHLHTRISGRPDVGSLGYWKEKFFPEKLGSTLSIGCGFGGFERNLIAIDGAEHVLGIDVAPGAIEGARAAAAGQGFADRISYEVIDVNTYSIPERAYDAIFGISSIHHIENLEGIFDQSRRGLKPGGLLFLDEYIGPTRWQYGDDVRDIMNAILAILPPRLRRPFHAPDTVRGEAWRPALSWFDEVDPSESVRSADIVPVLKDYFDIVDYRPYGGEIMHILLSGIAGNFMDDSEEDVALLRMIALLEDTLERNGVIQPDFAAIVAKPKA